MDGNNKDNSTHKDVSSPVEFEQPCAFAASDNALLRDCGRYNGNNDATVLNLAESKVEEFVGVTGTGDHQVGFIDGQVSSLFVLSELDSEKSEREVSLESNESGPSPVTKAVKVTENMMTDTPRSVDESAAGFSESGEAPNGEMLEVVAERKVSLESNGSEPSPLTDVFEVTENLMTDVSVEVATGFSVSCETLRGGRVDPYGKDNMSAEMPVSLDNQKRKESSTSGDEEIMCLNLEDTTENNQDGSLRLDLQPLDITDNKENGQVVTGDLCLAGHVGEVALKCSENNEIIEAVSRTENIILQQSNNCHPEESDVEGKLGCSASERSSSIVSADLGQVHGRNVIDVMPDIKNDNVTDRFGNSVSESCPRAIVAEELLKEAEIQQAEKKQDVLNFTEHIEELDYEEDDGSGRPEKLEKQDQENTQDGRSDKDEGELTDDDCEEGEIKEPGSKKFVKPLCRFFQRGSCSWGVGCRFLHPGVNDKGNYQLIEMPGCVPAGVRSQLGVPGMWPEQLEEAARPPPPPVPEVPLVETAWERGLRLAKERKKAAERKEKEPDFEDKRLNLSVDNEWELNKENERLPTVAVKDPYYDQAEYDEYYKVPREPWPAGHYDSQVRYNQDTVYSPAYQDKPPVTASARYDLLYGPPEDKFQQDRLSLREPLRLEAPSLKRPDEWTDPWSRTKLPKALKRKAHRTSRGKQKHTSASDDSNSSRSRSRSSDSSRSSRSSSSSSGSSSRSRSAETVPPGLDKRDRYLSPSRDQSRSSTFARGQDAHPGYYQSNRGQGRYQRGGYHVSNGGSGYYSNNYGGGGIGPAGGYPERNVRDRSRDRTWKARGRSPPDRPLPYTRPRPKSASSNSDSSRSRSRSRIRISSSRSRSSSRSSRSSSSSSSSAGSADSDHLYRDLGNPSKNPQTPLSGKKSKTNSRTTNGAHLPAPPVSLPAFRLDQIPTPQDPKPPPPLPGKAEPKYASRNAPLPPVRAKDPLKTVGQKSNIKLTLLPKQASLGSRPNPLDSPPHKRQLDSDVSSPESSPPAKRPKPTPEASVWRHASEKAAKLQPRPVADSLPISVPQPSSSLSTSSASSLPGVPQGKAATLPQKQPAVSVKPRIVEPAVATSTLKAPVFNKPMAAAAAARPKKNTVSRREELLKQLKAVEDAIAKKKGKLP